jgi:hypothetical protein
MLGDQIGEDAAKITSQKVLDVVGGIPKMELLSLQLESIKA